MDYWSKNWIWTKERRLGVYFGLLLLWFSCKLTGNSFRFRYRTDDLSLVEGVEHAEHWEIRQSRVQALNWLLGVQDSLWFLRRWLGVSLFISLDFFSLWSFVDALHRWHGLNFLPPILTIVFPLILDAVQSLFCSLCTAGDETHGTSRRRHQ